jgi:uncharacterized protein with ACT and thioredoxin-like domain
MKTLIIISLTAWVTVIAHNEILDNDKDHYRFRRDSIDTVCAIHEFYKGFEQN